jgi:hypothetical protein
MAINEVILVVITTVVLFLQGFYFGKRQILRLVIVSLMLILFDLVSIVSSGVYTYSGAILNASKYQAAVAIIYVVFWWGLGYIASHLVLVREKDIGKVTILKIRQ